MWADCSWFYFQMQLNSEFETGREDHPPWWWGWISTMERPAGAEQFQFAMQLNQVTAVWVNFIAGAATRPVVQTFHTHHHSQPASSPRTVWSDLGLCAPDINQQREGPPLNGQPPGSLDRSQQVWHPPAPHQSDTNTLEKGAQLRPADLRDDGQCLRHGGWFSSPLRFCRSWSCAHPHKRPTCSNKGLSRARCQQKQKEARTAPARRRAAGGRAPRARAATPCRCRGASPPATRGPRLRAPGGRPRATRSTRRACRP